MLIGTTLLCGSGYHHALTGKRRLTLLAGVGNSVLFLGWLSIAL